MQVGITTLLVILLPILSVPHPQILSALPPFPPQLALKGWESRHQHIMLPARLLWGCVCAGKVTRQKDHQAGVGRGGSVPLHSVLVALGGKRLVCMAGFWGGGFLWRFLPRLLNGPWRATTKIEPMNEIHEVREPRSTAVVQDCQCLLWMVCLCYQTWLWWELSWDT